MMVTANLAWALEPVGATVVLSPQSNKPLQRTGPAPAFVYRRFGEPAPQLNVMYVGLTRSARALAKSEALLRLDQRLGETILRASESRLGATSQ